MMLVLFQPIVVTILIDMYSCWQKSDMFNIIRHSTILGPFLGAFFKMFLMHYKRAEVKRIIDEINDDYLTYNNYNHELKQIALESIKSSVFFVEQLWTYTVTACIMAFPVMGIVLTFISHLTQSEPKKYMVHDLKIPFRPPEDRFETPFFEIMFVYMFLAAIICVLNYVSYDGLFGLACYHACLKMRMFSKKLEYVFQCKDGDAYSRLVQVIEEQKATYEYNALVQNSFDIWLGTIVISTMIQLGSLLFHISAGYGFDFRYMLFSCTSVVHIFLPCTYASKLRNTSVETSTLMYCSGWERSRERRIVRVMPFLLARAQIASRITAFYLFDVDMQLFVTMMRTSYTIFTLLRT
ncbi:unnamed protein product [Chilo suppressalis]|uniref:Odorant receptor n=1 Tax=Chilo suppressalis TaxID=168631 RepID=A0ABN8B8Y7_CHISP|nr:unnamed protein product [Chilo suppressalis]